MIEILNVQKFRYYSCRKNAFLFFFFKQENGQVTNQDNLASIKKIQSLEVEYKDLPLIGFNYDDFINMKPNEVNSFLDILVKHDFGETILYEKVKPENIVEIFDFVRMLRYQIIRKGNKQYQSYRYSMGTWVANASIAKINPLLKCDKERIKRQNILMGIKNELNIHIESLFESNKKWSEIGKSNIDNDKWRKKPQFRKYIEEKYLKNVKPNECISESNKIINNSKNLKYNTDIGFEKFKKFKLSFSKLPFFQKYQQLEYHSKILNQKLKIRKFHQYKSPRIYAKKNCLDLTKSQKCGNILLKKNFDISFLNICKEKNYQNISKSHSNSKYEILAKPRLNQYEYFNKSRFFDSKINDHQVSPTNIINLEKYLQHLEKNYYKHIHIVPSSIKKSNIDLPSISYRPNMFLYFDTNFYSKK